MQTQTQNLSLVCTEPVNCGSAPHIGNFIPDSWAQDQKYYENILKIT